MARIKWSRRNEIVSPCHLLAAPEDSATRGLDCAVEGQ